MPPTISRDPVTYRLDLTGQGHEVRVTVTLADPDAAPLRLWMPAWAPGSYLIREFARHVDAVRAVQAGRTLAVRKVQKDEWEVADVAAGSPLVVEYRLYAHELTVRTNYLGPDRALLNGPATYLVPAGREAGRFRVEVLPPSGWPSPECALPWVHGAFEAADLDALLDSPVAAGPCSRRDFVARGVPHALLVYGEGDCDPDRLAGDLQSICDASAAIFGGEIPCERYLFLVEIGISGGLEHAACSVSGLPTLGFADEAERRRRLGLLAHEYFHLWNVKRIRPRALGPFDYRREVHTSHLWVAEGFTTYFEHVVVTRARLQSPERFLAILAGYVLDLERTPGRHAQSLEESSTEAWIKYYRPHENSRNSQVSYYGKGAVAAAVLDLEIRRRTAGARGLEDALRTLHGAWMERPDEGFTDEELVHALTGAAGGSMDDVLRECVRTAGDIDVDLRLAGVGLRLDRRQCERGGWLGVSLRDRAGRLGLEAVVRDGPAWTAGLSQGEELIAIDGFRVGRGDVTGWLDERRPGDEVVVTSSLWSKLREVPVRLGKRPSRDYRFQKLDALDADGRAAFEAWLGVPWETFRPLDEKHEDQRSGDLPLDL